MEEAEYLDQDVLRGEDARKRTNRTRLIILIAVLGLALGYMVYAAFPGNALFSMGVGEFLAKEEVQDGRVLRVSGKLVDGSFHREDGSTLARFQLIDKEGGASVGQLPASYVGVVPDLFFDPHSEIVLQGSYGPQQVFEADTILVKCPSKYQSLEEELRQSS